MNLPDLIKWPEGATHWSPATRNEGLLEAYWRPDESGGYDCWAITDEPRFWQTNGSQLPSYAVDLVRPWTGEGLPPVGTVCEYKHVHEWQKVEVFAIKPNHNGSHTALFTYENGTWCGCAEPSFFRPIRTPEQIEAEEREKAIKEIGDIGIKATTGWAAAIYDAGYRKQVAP